MVPISHRQHAPDCSTRETLHVLLVVTDLEIGGTPLQVYRLARGLKRLGCRVGVACLAGYGPIANRLDDADIAVFPLGARCVRDIGVVWRIWRLVCSLRPDVCHAFLVHANVITRLVAYAAGIRAVVTTICTAERQNPWHLALENATCRLADRTVCISQGVTRHMRRRAHIPAATIRVIRPGIDVDHSQSARPISKESLTSHPDSPVICCVGRLDPVKRVDLVIRAMATIADRVHAGLAIVGDGPQRNDLEGLVDRLGLRDRVRFLGFRDDVPGVLKSCDLFVLASQQEGWSIATAEALAVGLPVVVTDVEGPAEQIDPGRTGVLVPPGDAAKLAEGMLAALRLSKRPAGPARSFADEARDYLDLYRKIISCKTRS